MSRKWFFGFTILAAAAVLAACQPPQASPTQPQTGLPNPASVFCEENGGKLELRSDQAGAVTGICIFPDGSECEEWAFFRKECQPGEFFVTPDASILPLPAEDNLTPTEEVDEFGWKVYHDLERGFSFHYPSDAAVTPNDLPLTGINITGPLVDDMNWPQMNISYPIDREEYQLPEGADLATWMTEHNLMMEDRKEDMQIAGETAVHLRHNRGEQSYAADRFFFAKDGQIYVILIGHAGDKEDWELYNRFLNSISFD
jgi:putative hemolysin